MNVTEQGAHANRHRVIPRTLIFLTSTNEAGEPVVLLLRGASTKRLWANKYNGLGGHIETAEDVHAAALRELREETGIVLDRLTLRGVVHIDTGSIAVNSITMDSIDNENVSPGVMVFVFGGAAEFLPPIATREGQAEWIPFAALDSLPAVDDVRELLALTLASGDLFYGRYLPQPDGTLMRFFA